LVDVSPNAKAWMTIAGTQQIFAELLIDCEEDRDVRAVPFGMLREAER
jgi:hypothetical protein